MSNLFERESNSNSNVGVIATIPPSDFQSLQNIFQNILCSLSHISKWLAINGSDLKILQKDLKSRISTLMQQVKSVLHIVPLNGGNLNALNNIMTEMQSLFLQIIDWLSRNELNLDKVFDTLSPQIKLLLTELNGLSEFIQIDLNQITEMMENLLETIVLFTKWLDNNQLGLKTILDELCPIIFSSISYLERITIDEIQTNPMFLRSINLLSEEVINTLSLFMQWLDNDSNLKDRNQLLFLKNLIQNVQRLLLQTVKSARDKNTDFNQIIQDLKCKMTSLLTNLKYVSTVAGLNPIYAKALMKLLQEIQCLISYSINLMNANTQNPNLDTVYLQLKPRLITMLKHIRLISKTIKLRPNDFKNLKDFSINIFNSVSCIVSWLSNNQIEMEDIVNNLFAMVDSLLPYLRDIPSTCSQTNFQMKQLEDLLQYLLGHLVSLMNWLNCYYTNIGQNSPESSILLSKLNWFSKSSHLNKVNLPELRNIIQSILNWITQLMRLLNNKNSNIYDVTPQLCIPCEN